MTTARKTRTKVMVKIWPPLLEKLNRDVEPACLRRDAYLDRVFRTEAKKLDEEVIEANSDSVRAELTRSLSLLSPKPMSFALSQETADVINDVCRRKNVPRDCFVNRVLFFLVLRDSDFADLIRDITLRDDLQVDYSEIVGDDEFFKEVVDPLLAGQLMGIAALVQKSLFLKRKLLSQWEPNERLHRLVVPKDYFGTTTPGAWGLNCRLDDPVIAELVEKVVKESLDSILDARTRNRSKPARKDNQ